MTSATRERLISAGLRLFTLHGIGQVGLDRVLQHADLTKTTFYNHFSSKEELIREVLYRHDNDLRERLEKGLRVRSDDAREQLLAIFDVLKDLNEEGRAVVCLVLSAIIEFPTLNDPIHTAAVRCKDSFSELLIARTSRLGVEEPKELAYRLRLIIDGVLVDFKVTKDPATFHHGRRLAELAIDAAMSD